MTWIKLDDKAHRNPKLRAVSDRAFRVFILALSYCGDCPELTGYLANNEAVGFARSHGKPAAVIDELATAGLLEPVNGGYLIHDWDKYLPKTSTDRVRRWRDKKRSEGVAPPFQPRSNGVSPLARTRRVPEPVPVPEVTKAPLLHPVLPVVVPFDEQPETRLAVWWQEFNGGQITEHDKQAAAAFIVDCPRLQLDGIKARITEHAAWRAENGKRPLGKLEFYRDALREQETHLADAGVLRPREVAS